jgi:hypothetical protein
MSEPKNTTLFFENKIYRRNRLIDAARMLPVFGFFLFVMPAIFIVGSAPTATRWVFLFVVWVVLIFAAALISHAIKRSALDAGTQD